MEKCKALLCLSVFFIFFNPSLVGAVDDAIVEIDKIIIVDSKDEDTKGTTEPSTAIGLKATRPQTSTVAEVVGRSAGVHIQRYGGLEDATAISIRGSTHEQVSVVLDGVNMDTASGEGMGVGLIPTSSLAKIEIFKSLTPSELGGSAVGGVLNITSKAIEKGLHHRYGAGFGSFMTIDGLAETAYGGMNHDFLFGIDYRRSQGNFTFQDNNGTPLNPNDDQQVERQNNRYQIIHPWLKWRYRLDARTQTTITGHMFRV
ncbi:MAG: TonB-dependent receptor plug domain-containing protein, partial [Deltaproteobacteria bacterium]|nr:TonB-dependent receptor plug domain-containing protein [Deltaproteobacteria bacterium]